MDEDAVDKHDADEEQEHEEQEKDADDDADDDNDNENDDDDDDDAVHDDVEAAAAARDDGIGHVVDDADYLV